MGVRADRRRADQRARRVSDGRRAVKASVALIVPAVLGAVAAAWLSGELSPVWTHLLWTAVIAWATVGLIWVWRPRGSAILSVLLVLVLGAGSLAVWRLEATQRKVVGWLDFTCADTIWEPGRVACYTRSADTIVDQWEALDPALFHAWDELDVDGFVSADRLSDRASSLEASTFSTVGMVQGSQWLGGQIVVQLSVVPVEVAEDPLVRDSVQTLFGADAAEDVVESFVGEGDEDDLPVVLYCAFTPRHFFEPGYGDVLAVNGVAVASGLIPVQIDKVVTTDRYSVVYSLCSSVERVADR